MDSQSRKASALDELYGRVEQIAGEMAGTFIRLLEPVRFLNALVATPRYENTPSLHVTMPDDFHVKFTPSSPLTAPTLLCVTVRLDHQGCATVGNSTTFLKGAWHVGRSPLTEDQIRAWLTLNGPPPARSSSG
jgi:hypothetical protein